MKKDYIRDYAVEAFRFYARKGKPNYEDMKKQIQKEAELSNHEIQGVGYNISDPTLYKVLAFQEALDKKEAELLDILAVSKVISILNSSTASNSYLVRKSIEEVYFKNPFRVLKKRDITERVLNISMSVPCSERLVYYYLKKARDMFAIERKLRLTQDMNLKLFA